MYGYDAIGSFDKVLFGTAGTGMELVVPVLDNQLKGHNCLVEKPCESLEKAQSLIKDVMNSCAERDIYTGDQVELVTITKEGAAAKYEPLRND